MVNGGLGSLPTNPGATHMDQSEVSKSAPSLNVFAPTSQLAAARHGVNQRARSNSTSPQARQAIGSKTTKTNSTKRNPAQDGIASSGYQIDLTRSAASSIESIKQETSEHTFLVVGAISALPSWMISLIVHMALILILAISSFSIQRGDQILELELADSTASLETMLTEIEFEDVVVEDEQDSLAPVQTESLVAEKEEMIPLEMFEIYTAESVVDRATELAFPNGSMGSESTGSGKKRSSAKFFGTKSFGSRFVFVIDCSLSMKGNRWYRAIKELNEAIDGLRKGQEFLVLLYNERTSVMMGVRRNLATLVPATEENKESCRRWLRKQRTQGGTFPANAMFTALQMDPDAVFLLSDGELQDNTRELLQFWNLEQERTNGTITKIPIHTISLGKKQQGQKMMRSIARENDGEFKGIR